MSWAEFHTAINFKIEQHPIASLNLIVHVKQGPVSSLTIVSLVSRYRTSRAKRSGSSDLIGCQQIQFPNDTVIALGVWGRFLDLPATGEWFPHHTELHCAKLAAIDFALVDRFARISLSVAQGAFMGVGACYNSTLP